MFVTLLSNNHMNVVDQAVWALGNIAGDGSECREFTVRCGIIPPLLALIKPDVQVLRLLTKHHTWRYLFFLEQLYCSNDLLRVVVVVV